MLTFSQNDIEKWSDFSGDYNPLHYRNSDAGNPVQGMLIFIYIMEKIIDIENAWGNYLFNLEVLFRHHVLTDNNYLFSYEIGSEKICISDALGHQIISGRFHHKNEMDFFEQTRVRQISERIKFTLQEEQEGYLKFSHCFFNGKDSRLFLVALTFTKLIHSRTFLDLYANHFSTLHEYLMFTDTLQVNQSITLVTPPPARDIERLLLDEIVISIYKCQSVNDGGNKNIRFFYYDCHFNNSLIFQGKTTVVSFDRHENGEDG
uniref:hypothetical protein n=1 Tax=Serratia TaxID=613 RepID=UPI001F4C1C22|nr:MULTISPECIES: hypothetical protein [Serratia]ULG12130.1 hypothetical protein D1p2_00016 [Serratia entomophila]ULG12327.1 hypothetical protein M3p_00029 [Serratia entomophila]ULG12351.1 hypothetical protein M3p_00055 [Serratia entomophila]ULG15957.1 hypothetical protein 591p_00106 [Serratia proteamaculans]ULG18445.1 hypothetical protein Man4p_00128 [Serratia proteamaculans]